MITKNNLSEKISRMKRFVVALAFFASTFVALAFVNGYGKTEAKTVGGTEAASVVSANGNADDFNFTNLIVFARFKGESEFILDEYGGETVKGITENCYERGEYSVNDYYYLASNGKVKTKNLYLSLGGGSIELERERGYYCSKDATNPIGYESGEYALRMYDLKRDWSSAIMSAIAAGATIENYDGSRKYDLADLDKNKDGELDALTIIYKYSDLYSVAWSDCLWNYQDYYNGVNFDGSSLTSGAYLQFTANYNYLYSDSSGRKFPSLKTAIHETGHIFGLKDLYRSESNSRVYYMSAMSNAISPVPQYISSKEREALGWLDEGNVVEIQEEGTYTVNVTSDKPSDGVVCYKIPLASKEKTLYLEYRDFSGDSNKYDKQAKDVYNASGKKISPLSLKSGLVCFLADKNTKFPNNLNTYGSRWNYEVLGGSYATKSDAALGLGDSLMASNDLTIEVVSASESSLTFRIIGNDIEKHVHSSEKIGRRASTCLERGNVEHWKCSTCGKLFLDESLSVEVSKSDVELDFVPCVGKVVKGYAATCSKTGLTDGEECLVCGKTLVERKEISRLPHSPSEWIIVREATPSNDGERVKKCSVCQETLEREFFEYAEEGSGEEESESESESSNESESESEFENISESELSSESESTNESEFEISSESESDSESKTSDENDSEFGGCFGGLSNGGSAGILVAAVCAVALIKRKEKLR